MADFNDDEDLDNDMRSEWPLVGKVLSPIPLSASTILSAMRPTWGNPCGLKIRMVGEKGENIFIAEFGGKVDWDRALGGSPWIVGKYSVLLQEYDEKLSAAEIKFEHIQIWPCLLNLPLGWMNDKRGKKAMDLLGDVIKMDVDSDGKAWGAFLRARIKIELEKPIKRRALLRMTRSEEPKWCEAQYEILPFFCFSCGVIGHSQLDCPSPAERSAEGKLPYQTKTLLRAVDDRRKKIQSFAEAAAESFGSGSSTGSRHGRDSANNPRERKSDLDVRK